jgi:iron complex outermembrane receptor protein
MKMKIVPCRDGLMIVAGMLAAIGGQPAIADDSAVTLPDTLVTASRLGDGITGASTTVITADEIERSPGQTIPEILARVPGIQVKSNFGGVNSAQTTIDMRGFGATATSNTLILVNGRRLNDVDMSAVDLSAIPRDSIERIEVIHGNAGAVLYGDGAVGGVVNIVTKNAINTPNQVRAEAAIGSLGYREATAGFTRRIGNTALSLNGSQITSDGYRDNNDLKQRSVAAEIRQGLGSDELYLNLSADDQHLGYPGTVPLSSLVVGNRRGTGTPDAYGDKQGVNATFGGRFDLNPGLELVADAGIRHKEQQAEWFTNGVSSSYTDTSLTTFSLTPRLNGEGTLGGLGNRFTAGLDYYHSLYDSDRYGAKGTVPTDRYHLQQRSLALYGQDTLALRSDTDLSLGARVVRVDVSGVDRSLPGYPGANSVSDTEYNYAAHLGLEHRLTDAVAVFGRIGRSLRLPNVDDRVGSAPYGTTSTMRLKTQTSRDIEAGLRGQVGRLDWRASAYAMDLNDEIHFDTTKWVNLNLDPTRRYGIETGLGYRLTDTVRLKAGGAYTQAKFREGRYEGNDVPLVAPWTATGGVSWDAWDKYVVLDLDARYVGRSRMDNDQTNFQPLAADYTLVDLRIGGTIEPVDWSFTVQNLGDVEYADLHYANTTTYGAYSAYTMPGRTMVGRLGVRF